MIVWAFLIVAFTLVGFLSFHLGLAGKLQATSCRQISSNSPAARIAASVRSRLTRPSAPRPHWMFQLRIRILPPRREQPSVPDPRPTCGVKKVRSGFDSRPSPGPHRPPAAACRPISGA